MNAARRRVAAWLALAAALAGCAAPRTRVVLVGDSITAGQSSAPAGPGYAELLKDLLGSGYEIVNVACSGSSSLDWLPGTEAKPCGETGKGVVHIYEVRARPALPADVATILLGTNDLYGAFEPAPIEPDAYAAALQILADALHADGAREVLLISPPNQYGAGARLANYRSRIRALCKDHPYIRCGPDLVEVLSDLGDFAIMDVHPNASGHAKIAAAVAEALRGMAPQSN